MDTFSHIAGYLSGSCSPEEAAQLDAWRKASAANEAEFIKMKKLWEAAAPASFCPDADQAWQKVQTRIKAKVTAPSIKAEAQPAAGRHWLKTSWNMAAVLALLLLSTGVYLLLNSQESFIPAGLASIETAAQEKQQLLLADGTKVWLNQHSSLYYPPQFGTNSREVFLKGEAFFEVAHQPERPFFVETKNSRVQVLGTAFNLKENTATRLQVKSGRVQFSSKKAERENAPLPSLILSAGEAAILEKNIPQKETLPLNYLSWQSGEFEFSDTSLEEVFHLLEQYYPVTIEAENPSLLKCRLNARFERQPLEEVLEVIGLSFQLRYRQNGQEVIFYGNGNSCTPDSGI